MIEAAATNRPVAALVAEAQRIRFIPRMLPGVPVLIAEFTVFNWMERLSAQYAGGLWNYYEVSNGAFYMAPTGHGPMLLEWADNYFSGDLSEDAAGIVASLFALSHLSFRFNSNALADNYTRLLDYAYCHPEAVLIGRAID